MILDTMNIDKVYASLSDILNLDRGYIENYVSSNYRSIVECHYDEDTIESMNISELLRYGNINIIDAIVMHHITPRPNEDSIWQEGIYTLPKALITNTMLSSHLKKYGITFVFENNRVVMKKNDVEVEISKLHSSNLIMRFGGEYSLNNFNVNGYLFVDKFDVDYIRGWLGSPEILKSLSEAFRNHNIADSYAEQSQNYYVSFVVSLDKVDITGFDANISPYRKTEILTKYAINALAHEKVKRNLFYTMHNPIIMLKRDYNVPPSDIKKIWIFDSTNYPKFVPVEQ